MNASHHVVLQVLVSSYGSTVQNDTDKWTEFGSDSLVLTRIHLKPMTAVHSL